MLHNCLTGFDAVKIEKKEEEDGEARDEEMEKMGRPSKGSLMPNLEAAKPSSPERVSASPT